MQFIKLNLNDLISNSGTIFKNLKFSPTALSLSLSQATTEFTGLLLSEQNAIKRVFHTKYLQDIICGRELVIRRVRECGKKWDTCC